MSVQRNSPRIARYCIVGRLSGGLLRGTIEAHAALGAEAVLAGDTG
jgi:hypothetical protein